MESIFKLGILLSVVDRVSGPSGLIGRNLDALKARAGSLGPAFDKFKTYGLRVATAGALMLHVLTGTAMATVDTQKALGELASVGVTDMLAMETAAARFSNQWAGVTKADFVAAAYDIKSGISSLTDAGVAEFTRLAALTGKATKSSTAEMTNLFATGFGIYKDMYGTLSDQQFGELFSAGIGASVKTFKTTGSGMASAISTLGAAATTAKVPLEEQLAILGMLQATMSGSEAGTKYKAIMASAAGAGTKLGLSFTDVNNQLLSMPQILEQLRGKFGDTLDAVEKMEIQKAFGTIEAVAVVDLLYGKVGSLTGNIRELGSAMRTGTATTEQMAAAMNQDIGAGLGVFGQQWHNLVEIIGKQLIPVLAPSLTHLGRAIMSVQRFAESHGTLTRVAVIGAAIIALLALTFGVLAVALGTVGLVAPSIPDGLRQIGTAASWLKLQLLGAIKAMWAWIAAQYRAVVGSVALNGGFRAWAAQINRNALPALWRWIRATISGLIPALMGAGSSLLGFAAASWAAFVPWFLAGGWVVVAVAAIVAALTILYHKFEAVKAAVDFVIFMLGYLLGTAVWVGRGFMNAFTHPIEFVQALWWGLGQDFSAVAGWIGKWAGWMFAVVKWAFLKLTPAGWMIQAFGAAKNFLESIDWSQSGAAIIDTLIAGVNSRALAVVDSVTRVFKKVRDLLPFSDAKEGPLSSLTLSGARIMETLGAGVMGAAPGLHKTMGSALAGAVLATSLTVAPVAAGEMPAPTSAARASASRPSNDSAGKTITIQHLTVQLPGVADADMFIRQLQALVEGYDV